MIYYILAYLLGIYVYTYCYAHGICLAKSSSIIQGYKYTEQILQYQLGRCYGS